MSIPVPLSLDDAARRTLLQSARRIAVLGIKTAQHSQQPAYYVPAYLQRVGYELLPVPVYYPDATQILGQPVFRRLDAVPGPVDVLVVFRRPQDLLAHQEEILVLGPRCVWFQSGIRHDDVAHSLREAGILVVQDACLMVEHRRLCP